MAINKKITTNAISPVFGGKNPNNLIELSGSSFPQLGHRTHENFSKDV